MNYIKNIEWFSLQNDKDQGIKVCEIDGVMWKLQKQERSPGYRSLLTGTLDNLSFQNPPYAKLSDLPLTIECGRIYVMWFPGLGH